MPTTAAKRKLVPFSMIDVANRMFDLAADVIDLDPEYRVFLKPPYRLSKEGGVSLRMAAFMLAIQRVARAVELRGI